MAYIVFWEAESRIDDSRDSFGVTFHHSLQSVEGWKKDPEGNFSRLPGVEIPGFLVIEFVGQRELVDPDPELLQRVKEEVFFDPKYQW